MSNINKRALREAAERATESDWIVDAHEGWHAVIPVADAVNGNYIIAEFQGPESKRNRDFVAAANPATVLALLDELEAAEKTSAARLGAIDTTHKMFQRERGRAEKAEKRIAELSQKADIYDMLRQDYGLQGSLVEFVDWQAKRIAELEKSHAQVIQARDHYKRMCEEGFRRINKGINLSINGEG